MGFPFIIGKVLTTTKPAPTKPHREFPSLIGKVLTREVVMAHFERS